MSFLTLLWWKQFVLHDVFILTGDEIEVHNDVKCIFFLVDEFAWYRLYAKPFTEVLCWKRYVHSVWQAEFVFELV